MYDQTERELKILVSAEVFHQILDSMSFEKPVKQTNVYYDDDKGTVRKLGAIRIRTIGRHNIFTFKIRKDPITQIELEKPVDAGSIEDITDPEILNWLAQYHIPRNLKPFASSTTVRYIHEFSQGELCLDQTQFTNHEDYEIEYEYKMDHDGISFFNDLLKPYGLTYTKNAPSKLARAVEYSKTCE